MSIVEALILGLIQGLCEFLPVSSSGHLELARRIFHIDAPGILLETLLHAGTLGAVLIYFRQDILEMLRHPLSRQVRLLVVATIPAVVLTLLLGDWLNAIFSGALLGVSFLLTALVLWLSSAFYGSRTEVFYRDAGLMGIFQAAALLPGLSRSGSTIAGGMVSGLDREAAARFSFLMSIPAILGGLLLQIREIVAWGLPGGVVVLPLIAGILAAMGAGLFAIGFMMRIVRKAKLKWFGLYTLALGIMVLADQLFFRFLF